MAARLFPPGRDALGQIERRDYMLQTVAPKRKKAVARNGFEIVTVAEIPAGLESLAARPTKIPQIFLRSHLGHHRARTR